MKFFYAHNLTDTSVKTDVMPWEFNRAATGEAPIEDHVRKDKTARQLWYKNPNTKHYFYTALEGVNSTQRPGNTNPVHCIHAFVADCDVPLADERLKEILATLPIKPTWKERSIGGNYRLVWLLEKPMTMLDEKFTPYLLEQAARWLHLDELPGLDESAFTNFSRLLCCGDSWEDLHNPPVPLAESTRFHFECVQKYRAKTSTEDVDIPMDQIVARIKELFPNFTWPGEFELLSHGPTFWAPGSLSPLSACVMKGGMYSHAAHAPKPFTPWADLLGADFVRSFVAKATATAVEDVWFDGSKYWRLINGVYNFEDRNAFGVFLKTRCRIDAKKVDEHLDFLHNERRVDGVGPCVLHPPGVIMMPGGRRVLNSWRAKIEQPAADDGVDRPFGEDFPFIWLLIQGLIPDEIQRDHVIAWHQRLYWSALNRVPLRGHNLLLMGEAGVGKSLVSSEILGEPVGGAANAASFLVEGKDFQGNLYEYPIWLCEDDTPANDHKRRQAFFSKLKNIAANEHQTSNLKHIQQTPIISFSRIIITANRDDVSAGVIPPLDDSSADKICLIETGDKPLVKFTDNRDMKAKIKAERPYYLRALLKWKRPEHVQPETNGERYGFKSFISPKLRVMSHSASDVSPVAQIVSIQMRDYFRADPNVKVWRGSRMELYLRLSSECRATFGSNYLGTPQLFNRHFKLAQRDKLFDLPCEMDGALVTFFRPENL